MQAGQIRTELSDARIEVLEALGKIPQVDRERRPTPDTWSARDVIEHLATVEARVSAGLRKSWQSMPKSQLAPWDPARIVPEKLAGLAEASSAVDAPEQSLPAGDTSVDELLPSMATVRDNLESLFDEMSEFDLSTAGWNHFAFGELNLAEWFLFLAWHERRHAGQLRRIAQALAI